MKKEILDQLERELPSYITRSHPRPKEWTGVSGRRMANLDCLGQGPKERMLLGREIIYPRQALLDWIAGRLQEVDAQGKGVRP